VRQLSYNAGVKSDRVMAMRVVSR